MIISHKHEFIFLKTNKTAGTSFEIALSKFCGDTDIIAPITSRDEKIRGRLGYRTAQNYIVPFSHYALQDWKDLFRNSRRLRFYNHISAREVRHLIGETIWSKYYKFCFERNPWDRLISLYYGRCKKEPRPSISEFIDSRAPDSLKENGFQVYTIDGEVAVDKVYLYERLERELEEIAGRLGLPGGLSLPRAKGDSRKDRRHYREILGHEDRIKIDRMFAQEIELFGYQY